MTSQVVRDLGWLVHYRCACGREAWQRPELWSGVCVKCERAPAFERGRNDDMESLPRA